MTKRQFDIRKMVTFETTLWQRVIEYRFQKRINTETEAIRLLIEAGLDKFEREQKSK